MRTSDIIRRAFTNLQTNASRTKKTMISVAIGICSITAMLSLNSGINQLSKGIQGDGNELLKVEVAGVRIGEEANVLINLKGGAGRYLNDEDIKFLQGRFQNNVSKSYIKKLINLRGAEFDKYKIITNTVAVNYDALSNETFKYYSGGEIKNINGAIVSKSFCERILLTEDYEKLILNEFQSIDIIGKEITFKVTMVSEDEKGKVQRNDVDLIVRIDGVLENDEQHFGFTGGVWNETDRNSIFDYSVLYIPMERIEEFEALHNYQSAPGRRVTLFFNTIEEIESALNILGDKNYDLISKYKDYMSIKYFAFTLKLVFGTLGVLILITSLIGIINTMLMSLIERTSEIGIMKAIGIKVKYIRLLFVSEAAMIGLFGGIIGTAAGIIIIAIMNIVIRMMNNTIGAGSESIKIAQVHWYIVAGGIATAVISSIAASIPAVHQAVRISVSDALKVK
jgi:ABC-type antimicrobial peptide transport system permease subunit